MQEKDVFISYKSEEYEKAEQLRVVLEQNGISCWRAPNSIPTGSNYAMEIPKAIRSCSVFVILLSQRAQQSKWVCKELDRAINNGKVIVPVMLEQCPLRDPFDFYLTDVQRYEAFTQAEQALQQIVQQIQALLLCLPRNNKSTKTSLFHRFFQPKKAVQTKLPQQEFRVPEPAPGEVPRIYVDRLQPGDVIADRYEIKAEIGKGGASEVYLATDLAMEIPVAIKRMRSAQFVDFHIAKANLKKEFDLQKRCIHSNLSIIRDSVETETDFLIVLDYIPGQTLHDRIKEQGPLDEKAAIHLMLQLCDALHYLHTRPEPVYFQDVKPSNVMITDKDEAILIDFGAAAEEKEIHQWDTTILGTHGFAAPEQYSSCTDARTDIYGLGATMYYALTGKSTMEPPFEFLPVRQWQPQLSEEVEMIVAKAVMSNPEKRFQTIEQIRGELTKLR